MIDLIKRFLASPIFSDDEEKTRKANYINVIVLSNIPILVLFIISRISTGAEPFGIANIILLSIIVVLTIVWFLMRAGRVQAAGYLHVTTIWLASTMIALNGSGIRGTAFTSYFVVMLMAGLLLGWKSALGYTALSIAAGFGLAAAENRGIVNYIPGPVISNAIEGTVLTLFGAVFLYLIITSLQNAVQKANVTAGELRESNKQLTTLRNALELRVEERTGELKGRTEQFEAIADVARSVASIQEMDQLLLTITRLISERFGFYHVGIFLLDDDRGFALLQAANSEGGARMLARGHRLRVGQQGIVGFVTMHGTARIALDVGEEAVYFNNPDLPETHSEVALPLKFGREIIGALDIQSTERNAFSQEDIDLFSILADQVSVAIQNARSLEQAQRALREVEIASGRLTGQAWKGYSQTIRSKGYRYDGIKPEPLRKTAKQGEEKDAVTVPVQLRGQTIGHLKLKHSEASRKWTEDELAIIESTADRVAIAMDGARLLDEAQKRATRETFLSDLAAKLGTSFQMDSILRDTVEELGQTLKGSTVTFQLVNPSSPPTTDNEKSNSATQRKAE